MKPGECAWVLGTEGVVGRQLWNPNKDPLDPTPFGVPSGRIFHLLLPVPVVRNWLVKILRLLQTDGTGKKALQATKMIGIWFLGVQIWKQTK